jgi:predicted nucleotidyltransferase
MTNETSFKLSDHYRGNHEWLRSSILMLTKAGSHAYGMATPTSDLDIRGICIPPKEYFLGFAKVFEQVEIKGDPDVVIYDIRKFFKLAADCNPNIIEYLFVDPEDWVVKPAIEWHRILDHRHAFLSKKVKHSFSGYALSQLKRIQTHRRWLLNPPTHKPTREEYNLSVEHRALNREQMGAYDSLIADGHEFTDNVMDLLRRERLYQTALTEWTQHENWKESRNEARATLEAKFGYDTKHASHLVRLLRMAEEILSTGSLTVRRSDAKELQAIRAGAWSYDKLIAWSEDQNGKNHMLLDRTKLPNNVDYDFLNKLCMEVVESFHG